MNIVFYDKDEKRMRRNIDHFLKNDVIVSTVKNFEKLMGILCISDIVVMYEPDILNSCEKLAELAAKTKGVVVVADESIKGRKNMLSFACGVECVDDMPEAEELYNRVMEIYSRKKEKNKNMEKHLSNVLDKCGIPCHLKGYEYIKNAVRVCYMENSYCFGITKIVYPAVSLRFGTSPMCVERAIRNAIDAAWNEKTEFFGVLFSDKIGKRPSNAVFLRKIISYINNVYM